MCVVAWAESAAGGPNSYRRTNGLVWVSHIAEVLTYDFARRRVVIRLVPVVQVDCTEPIYIHFLHRRAVEAADATAALLDGADPVGRLMDDLGLVRPVAATPNGSHVRVRVEDGNELRAVVPMGSRFEPDTYIDLPADRRRRESPFTSVRFGPLEPQSTPYALGLSLVIEGGTFDHLIAVLRDGRTRYLYSIEGPDIVRRDIDPLDLRGSAADVRTAFEPVLTRGVQECRVDVASYDVLTLDAPVDRSDYVRLVSKVRQWRTAESMCVDGRANVVNSWHSDRPDFLIQRVSFFPA